MLQECTTIFSACSYSNHCYGQADVEGSCPSSAQLIFVSASRNASPHQWTSFQLLADKTNSELLRKPFFKVERKSLYRVEQWCHYHIWEIMVTFCITTWQTRTSTRTRREKRFILRSLLFLPTGTGRRPCLPRSYTKGKHDFPDVIIAVVPGSLPVCPGWEALYASGVSYRYIVRSLVLP